MWAEIKTENGLPVLDHESLGSPLEALIWCIDVGRYPPPEILLSLKDSWWEYLFATGSMSLEDAFIGKSVRKGGNFARRSNKQRQCLWLALLLPEVCHENPGLSQFEAAEFAVREFGLNIEAETGATRHALRALARLLKGSLCL